VNESTAQKSECSEKILYILASQISCRLHRLCAVRRRRRLILEAAGIEPRNSPSLRNKSAPKIDCSRGRRFLYSFLSLFLILMQVQSNWGRPGYGSTKSIDTCAAAGCLKVCAAVGSQHEYDVMQVS